MDDDGQNVVDNESRRRSAIWKYFDVVNRNEWLAKCKECNKLLSFRSSSSNLKKHLNRKHSDMVKISDDEEEETVEEITYLDDDGEQEADLRFDKRKILRNGAWEYFEVLDEERKLATCTICHEQFSYRTTSTNLAKHLRRRHCIEFEKVTDEDFNIETEVNNGDVDDDDEDDDDDDDSDDKNPSSADKRRSRTSAAWEFFTVKDHDRRIATCKLCDSQFSYLTSVSNLMKHVRKRHGVKTEAADDGLQYEEDAQSKGDARSHSRSSVWLYFKCIDPVAKMSVCLICKKQLSHLTSITNLKKHLYRKHPGVRLNSSSNGKKMLIASDGQLYEIEEAAAKREHADTDNDNDPSEPPEMNAIYLDDYEGAPERSRKRARSSSCSKRPRNRTYLDEATGVAESLSSDDEITFQKKYVRKKHDSLDQFGKYLVSLLKQLPKEVSNQLQADFVKQVMGAQLNLDPSAGGGYAITITQRPPGDEYAGNNHDAYTHADESVGNS